MNLEKQVFLSVDYSSFKNSEYSSQSLMRFYQLWLYHCPFAFLSSYYLISYVQSHYLTNLLSFQLYFCLYSSSLFGLFALRLIDKNFNALYFEPIVGYLGLLYPSLAKHFIIMLLRWCSRKAEQSFLLAIFFRSPFFSNQTGSLSGSLTISQRAGLFKNIFCCLAEEFKKYLPLQSSPNKALPFIRFFLASSTIPYALFQNLEQILSISSTKIYSGGEKASPLFVYIVGFDMKSFISFSVLKTQIFLLNKAIFQQFFRHTFTYSLLILQLIGQKFKYQERLFMMQLKLRPTSVTSEAE